MPEGDLTVTTRQLEGGGVVLEVAGELDLSTLAALEAELSPLASSRVVIDLSECTFLDSSALRAIVVANRAAAAVGGTLALVAPSAATRRVLDIASLDRVISVYDTVADATTP